MAKRTRRCIHCKADISDRGNKSVRCKTCQAAWRRQREEADPERVRCADDDGTCSPTRLKRGRCSRHYYTARRDNDWQIPQQPRACAFCGVEFTPVRSDAVCCSSDCNWRRQDVLRRVDHPERPCETCGTLFKPRWYGSQCCSVDCIADPARRAAARWMRRNPAAMANYGNLRRARERAHPHNVKISERDWQRLVRRFGGRCAYCDQLVARPTQDHVIPLSRGGRHGIANVVPACLSCNSSKGPLLLVEFRRRQKMRLATPVIELPPPAGGGYDATGPVRYEQLAFDFALGDCG